MGQGKRSQTLVGQLESFLQVPDNVLAIAQNQQLMRDLDVAFFKVGDARGASSPSTTMMRWSLTTSCARTSSAKG